MAKQPEVRYINYYVSGNLAYQPEKTHSHKQKVQLPQMPKEKRQQVTVDVTAVCCIALAVVLMLAVSALQLLSAKKETAVLQNYISDLQTENEVLQDTYTGSFDPEEIRGIAEELGMVPLEQVQHMTIQVQLPVQEEEPTVWQSIRAFITGLFA